MSKDMIYIYTNEVTVDLATFACSCTNEVTVDPATFACSCKSMQRWLLQEHAKVARSTVTSLVYI